MHRMGFLQVWNHIAKYTREHVRGINYGRKVCVKQRLFGTRSSDKPVVCIVGSGPAGFYTAQYLLKVV